MSGWLHHFEAFTAFHGVVVGVCAAVMVAAVGVGRRLMGLDAADGGRREVRFAQGIGWSIAAWQAFATVWRVLPGQWDLNESLPFHLCRWTGWIAAVCLIAGHRPGWRWSRSLMFFWGLGLSVHGFVTPMWNDGAATVAFWLYWMGHLQIVGVAVYDLAVRGFAPGVKDLAFALGAGVVYVLVVVVVNVSLGTNYSYLGSGVYEGTSVVDLLGRYPERMYKMIGGAMVLFVLMYGAARVLGVGRSGGATEGAAA